MNHWSFVTAAYAVTLIAVVGLLVWAHATMRRAEASADELKRPQ